VAGAPLEVVDDLLEHRLHRGGREDTQLVGASLATSGEQAQDHRYLCGVSDPHSCTPSRGNGAALETEPSWPPGVCVDPARVVPCWSGKVRPETFVVNDITLL
jgi:hypothetical protein